MTTLMIIDMQVAMSWQIAGDRNNPQAESNIERLLARWRQRKWPIVHVRHLSRPPNSLFRPGQAGVEFQERFHPFEGEHVIEKHLPDAFPQTGLEHWLRAANEQSIVIVGVSTNISVESTARTSGNLGFTTFVVADATFAFARRDFAGVLRSANEVHAMSLPNLDGEFATVVTTEEVVELASSKSAN